MATQLAAALRLSLVDDVSGTARQVEQALTRAARGGSGAVEQLRLKQLAAGSAARELSGELRRLQASGSATDQEIKEVSVALVRAREMAARFGAEVRQLATAERAAATQATQLATSVNTAATATQASATRTAAATRGMSAASKNAGREFGGMINVAAEMTYSFSTAIPSLRGFGMQMAMMGGTAYQMGAAFGVWGAAAGLVIGVLPSLISWLSNSRDETEAATAANREHARSIEEQIDAIRRAREARENMERARRGAIEAQEIEDRLAIARRTQASAQGTARSALQGVTGEDREVLDAAMEAGAGEQGTDERMGTLIRIITERMIAEREAAGETLDEHTRTAIGGVAMRRAMTLDPRLQRAANAQPALQAANEEVAELERGLALAREREAEEAAFERTQEAPRQARQRRDDLLATLNLSTTQRSRINQGLERGRLSAADRRLLGPHAEELLGSQGQITAAERAAARARLEQASADTPLPEAPIEEVRQEAVRRTRPTPRPAAPAAPAPPPDTSFLARFADDLDRARIRVVVEDQRVRTIVEGGSGSALEVDASSSDMLGGQQ